MSRPFRAFHLALPLMLLRGMAAAVMLVLASVSVLAQDSAAARESAVKAAFLYRFTSFVEWPPTALLPALPLQIAVLDDDALLQDLREIVAGRNAQGRPVEVRRVSTPQSAQGAHMLFVGRRTPSQLAGTVASIPPGATLLVSDQPDTAHPYGVALNFQWDAGRVRFTASPIAAEARGLRLNARLLNVAMAVEERR